MPTDNIQGPVPTRPGEPVVLEVDQGTLYAKPNGGSLRVKCANNVRFVSRYAFAIEFTQIAGTPYDWPAPKVQKDGNMYFADAKAPDVPPGEQDPPYYKYTATVGALKLDPIVIVDK